MVSYSFETEDELGRMKRVIESRPVDFQALLQELEILQEDLKHCEQVLLHDKMPLATENPPSLSFNAAEVLTQLEDVLRGPRTL